MQEEELRLIFSNFGPVQDISVIRDKDSNEHKGCAFLTFFDGNSALRAIEELHDKVRLSSSANLVQIRAAESSAEKENKLFVLDSETDTMQEIYSDLPREIETPIISRDGRTIFFGLGSVESDIQMLTLKE